jgi:hypothetical protein
VDHPPGAPCVCAFTARWNGAPYNRPDQQRVAVQVATRAMIAISSQAQTYAISGVEVVVPVASPAGNRDGQRPENHFTLAARSLYARATASDCSL